MKRNQWERMLTDTILNIMCEKPDARRDDRVLYLECLKADGASFTAEQEALILNGPRPGTVTRLRARVRNDYGRFPAP